MKRSRRIGLLILLCILMPGALLPVDAIDAAPALTAINCAGEVTVGYKETRQYEFAAVNLPADASVHVYCSGEDRGESTYLYVIKPTEDYTVEAKILGQDGSELASSGVIQVTVKNGFLDRTASFFKTTVHTVIDAVADVVGSFFVSILYFFDGMIH